MSLKLTEFLKDRGSQFAIGLLLGAIGSVVAMLLISILGKGAKLGLATFVAGYVGFFLLAFFAPTGRAAVFRLLVGSGLIILTFPYAIYLGPQDNLAVGVIAYLGFFIGIILILLGFIIREPSRPFR